MITYVQCELVILMHLLELIAVIYVNYILSSCFTHEKKITIMKDFKDFHFICMISKNKYMHIYIAICININKEGRYFSD